MLSVLMPSRGRPDLCKKAIQSAQDTAEGELEFLVYVDEDDPTRDQYKNPIIGPRISAGASILALSRLAKGDMLMFGCDDFTWETKGWDRIFRERMPAHGLAVLYYMDRPGAAKAINPVFTRKWMEVTGLFPGYFKHFGPDTWVIDTARKAGVLIPVNDVLIRHNKVQDDTYRASRTSNDAGFATKMLAQEEHLRTAMAKKIVGMING